ncbi:hypothetical protein BDV93DRAFT_510226 [Ceratobasidium sp. AG-I]|nr:hypothetical protein BDV93DRAFT_510226 [Ceratobasidium sp. AG-I]
MEELTTVTKSAFHGYKCTKCTLGFIVNQCAGTTETGGLVSHNNICPGQDSALPLTNFGITGGTGRMSAQQVCENIAMWMAKNTCPFQMINNRYLQKLIHPDVWRHQPHRDTISKDIRCQRRPLGRGYMHWLGDQPQPQKEWKAYGEKCCAGKRSAYKRTLKRRTATLTNKRRGYAYIRWQLHIN